MRRRTDALRLRIVDAAYESFWRNGFRRTTMSGIADLAGVTKRTLYAYVRSKDDLLALVLTHYRELAMRRLQQIGTNLPADAEGMLEAYFADLARWAGRRPRWVGSGITRLVMELGDLPGHPARAIARQAKSTSEAWLTERLAAAAVPDSAARAREVMLLLEGAMALSLIDGGTAYVEAAARAAQRLLRA